MKALSLHQPWASLVALGVKTIETRSWATQYRGRLAIAASKRKPTLGDLGVAKFNDEAWAEWWKAGYIALNGGAGPGPLGKMVAVCQLVDCLPIVDVDAAEIIGTRRCVYRTTDGELVLDSPDAAEGEARYLDVSDQLPYGNWEPGRAAWLLDKIVMLDPVPVKGALGLWDWEGGTWEDEP